MTYNDFDTERTEYGDIHKGSHVIVMGLQADDRSPELAHLDLGSLKAREAISKLTEVVVGHVVGFLPGLDARPEPLAVVWYDSEGAKTHKMGCYLVRELVEVNCETAEVLA